MPEVRRRSRQRDEYNRACTAATREPVQEQPGAMLWRHSIYIPERSIACASELTEQPESRNREGLRCGDIPYPEEIPGLPILLGRNPPTEQSRYQGVTLPVMSRVCKDMHLDIRLHLYYDT